MLGLKPDSRQDVIRNARVIEEQARVIDRVLRGAVAYLRPPARVSAVWSLGEELDAAAARWDGWARDKDVRLAVGPTDLVGRGRASSFAAAIDALLEIVLERCSAGDRMAITAGIESVQPPAWDAGRLERGDHVCVTLRAATPVEPPAAGWHEPWLDAAQDRELLRSALALAAAYEAAREHGGWVEPTEDGAGFRLVWSVVSLTEPPRSS